MFHGFDYPDEIDKDELHARFWRPTMVDGVITFLTPEECAIRKMVRKMKAEPLQSNGTEEPGLLEGFIEGR
jgi:CRISPR-associated protein Cas5d